MIRSKSERLADLRVGGSTFLVTVVVLSACVVLR
jgi:hypothetical protein